MHFIRLYKLYHIVAIFDSSFMHFYHAFYMIYICILLFYPLCHLSCAYDLLVFSQYACPFSLHAGSLTSKTTAEKSAVSAGSLVLQKLRHNIIAYIKSIIRQNEPVALKYCRFFLHKHFHEPRIDVLRGHPEPPLKLREGHPRCHP